MRSTQKYIILYTCEQGKRLIRCLYRKLPSAIAGVSPWNGYTRTRRGAEGGGREDPEPLFDAQPFFFRRTIWEVRAEILVLC